MSTWIHKGEIMHLQYFLLEVLDHVGSLLDGGKQVDMIYINMSKAFDKVNHGCLLQKFHKFGFGGSLLQWLVLT